MHPKVMRMRRLMNDGFTVHTIRSDTRTIEARLTDFAGTRVTVSFDATDAERLLFDANSFGDRHGHRRASGSSRWRVTQPLR